MRAVDRTPELGGFEDVLAEALEDLEQWLHRNGTAGYDPYDVKGLDFVACPRTAGERAKRFLTLGAEEFAPLTVRRQLRVEPTINAKGLGLLTEAYRLRYGATGDGQYLTRAIELAEWLLEHPSPGYSGLCWGYPFDWQSRVFIPKDTPSSVVSATVGHALWGLHETTGNDEYLHACVEICRFFLRDLNVDELGSDRICFSYTPIDRFHVHNANLLVSEFLLRIGASVGADGFTDTGTRALGYALSEQNADGSLCYWARDQDATCRTDHYHSGFDIRSLYGIWQVTGERRVREALTRYYDFYCRQLFDDQYRVLYTPTRRYPINVHSCAEAILCHSTVAREFPEAAEYVRQVAAWTVEHMQNADGSFAYMIRRLGPIRWTNRIPYVRWGQAWMFRALATAVLAFGEGGFGETGGPGDTRERSEDA